MGEFMQQQGDEEQGCRDQRSDPDLARAPIRVYLTKVLAEGERDQGSDNEPAVMKPDLDARDSSEFDVGAHSRPSLRETMQLRITGYSNSSEWTRLPVRPSSLLLQTRPSSSSHLRQTHSAS